MKNRFLVLAILAVTIFSFLFCGSASANEIKIESKSALLMSADTGEVLYQHNSNEKRPIASMVKIMTLLLCFDNIDQGKLNFDDVVTISQRASSMGGSQAFLDEGSQYKVDQLLKSISIASANDSCVAMAEHISGSVEGFVDLMNKKAKSLDMNDTVFVNCTGLPAPGQFSTAQDVAKMFNALIKHDDYFKYTTIWMDDFNHPSGRVTGLTNTNKLIKQYSGCDAGKTGYTSEAMHCLASTVQRNDMRLVSVIIGGPDSKTRFEESKRLFDFGFANYQCKVYLEKYQDIKEKIYVSGAKNKSADIISQQKLVIFGKKGENPGDLNIEIATNVKAPVKAGDVLGKAFVKKDNKIIAQVNLIAKYDIEKAEYADYLKEFVNNW